MKIQILGTRGEIQKSAAYHSKHSGILIDKKLLFDFGEKEFLRHNPKNIFLTHLHPDHAFFLRKKQPFLPTVYAPEKLKNYPSISIFKKVKNFYGYKIIPIPTIHSLKVKSQAYLIQKGKKKVLYTGDLVWIEKKYHHLLKDLDLVITEASYLRSGGLIRKLTKGKIYGHAGIPNLINLFKKFTDKIVLVHFGSWFYKDMRQARKKLMQLAAKNKVEIIVAYDGLIINV